MALVKIQPAQIVSKDPVYLNTDYVVALVSSGQNCTQIYLAKAIKVSVHEEWKERIQVADSIDKVADQLGITMSGLAHG